MTVTVRLPDGREIDTPANDAKGAAAIARQFLATEDARKSDQARAGGAASAMVNGATFGLGNIMSAAQDAAATGVHNFLHPDQARYGMADRFDATRRVLNDQDRQYASQHPGGSTFMSLLGGGMSAAPMAKAVIGSGRLLPAMARSAGASGILGSIGGAAASDPGKEAQGAVSGGLTGALTGAAVPAAGRVASAVAGSPVGRTLVRAASKASGAVGGPTLNPARQAALRLTEAMQRDGMTPNQIRQNMNDYLARGVTPSLMDAVNHNGQGQATLAALRGAAMKGPEARNIATQYDRQVGSDLILNAMRATRELTPGNTQTAEQSIAAQKAARSAEARTTYAQPYGQPVQVTPQVVSALADTEGDQALNMAIKGERANREYPVVDELNGLRAAGAASDDPVQSALSRAGYPPPLPTTTGRALDRVQNMMGVLGDENFRGGDGKAPYVGRGFFGRQADINSALDGVPGLAEARTAFRDSSNGINATELGQSGLQPTTVPADYTDNLQGLVTNTSAPRQPATQDAARVGLRSAIETQLGNAKPGAVGPLNTLRNGSNTQIMGATFGDEPTAAYTDTLDRLSQQRQNAAAINPNTGSGTAVRSEDGLEGMPLSKAGAVKALIDKVRSGLTLTDDEREAILRMGTGQADPSVFQAPRDPRLTGSPAAALLLAPYLGRSAGAVQ